MKRTVFDIGTHAGENTRRLRQADWRGADWSVLQEERDDRIEEEEEPFPALTGPRPRILIGVCSCRKNGARRRAVRETWFPRGIPGTEARFFIGDANLNTALPEEPDTVVLNAADEYIHLPGKVREFFRYALKHFRFDWLYKCDDDTYAAAERLPELCAGGEDLIGDVYLKRGGFAGGGSGYLLSRPFVERLAFDDTLPCTGAEDVILTRAAIRAGARFRSTARLQEDWRRSPEPENAQVSAHRCGPQAMHLLHTVLHSKVLFETEVAHPEWTDRLIFYANGLFIRRGTRRGGRWSFDPCGNRLLQWFEDAPEKGDTVLLTSDGGLFTEGGSDPAAVKGKSPRGCQSPESAGGYSAPSPC